MSPVRLGGALSSAGAVPNCHLVLLLQVEAAAVEKEGDDSGRSRLPEVLLEVLVDKVRGGRVA